MPHIELKYGPDVFRLNDPFGRFDIIESKGQASPLSDVEIGERLDSPINSKSIDEIVKPGDSVLIVVPDATREAAAGQVVNLVVRRIIAAGTAPFDIRVIFATGIHRKVSPEERDNILTPFINQRIKTLDHDPRDLARLIRLGETSDGIPVELDRALLEHDHVIIVGGVSFHYFAGFTGGRKLICPGLASTRTITATHKLAFDLETLTRRDGVGTGQLKGNAVHEAFVEAAGKIKPAFAINTIVDDEGKAIDLYCGHWTSSHEAACCAYAQENTVLIPERRELVIASCGGSPHDINMIQAHKTLDAASMACSDGGTIVLIAECSDGMGRADFLDWFDPPVSERIAEKLAGKYQVNGQTAWSLMKKAEQFKVKIVSSIGEDQTKKMRLEKIEASCLVQMVESEGQKGYILPQGARIAVKLTA